jgi:hypothetical protein
MDRSDVLAQQLTGGHDEVFFLFFFVVSSKELAWFERLSVQTRGAERSLRR